jgi:TetR/AcrR family transcriptional regulator, mexJK operon transcriptional repressor
MTRHKSTFVPKVGRPSLKRAEVIDARVIDAALKLFLANGFDAASMEQVALAAGVTKGTVYARHPTKEALLTAVIERAIEDWSHEASLNDHLLGNDIERTLRHHARTIARWVNKDEVIALQRLVSSVEVRFPELARVMYEHGYLYIVDLIARDIAAAAGRDGVPIQSAGSVARMLVASIQGANWQEGRFMSERRIEAFAQRVVDVLMAGRSAW